MNRQKIIYEKAFRTNRALEFHDFQDWNITFKASEMEEAIYAKNSKNEIIGHIARKGQWLYCLCVKKDYRKQGIASELIRRISQDTYSTSIWLQADQDALAFYRCFAKSEYKKAVDDYKKEHPKENVDSSNDWLKVDTTYIWQDYGELDNGNHIYGKGLKNPELSKISQQELKTLARNIIDKVGVVSNWFDIQGEDNKRIRLEEIRTKDLNERFSEYEVLHTYKIKSMTITTDEVTFQFETKQRGEYLE